MMRCLKIYTKRYENVLRSIRHQWESEEVYSFLICALCPINGDYIPDEPVEGFLFPAFSERSGNENRIDMYKRDTMVPGEGLLYLFWD